MVRIKDWHLIGAGLVLLLAYGLWGKTITLGVGTILLVFALIAVAKANRRL